MIFFMYFLCSLMNRFEKEELLNEHVVPAAREHDPFYHSKNRTFMPSCFS